MVQPEEWSPGRARTFLLGLLAAANRHYPDGFISLMHDDEGNERRRARGDTLALFVFREIRELAGGEWDPDMSESELLERIIRALQTGVADLESAIRGLEEYGAEGRLL